MSTVIVQCPSCEARFQLPADRIPAKGARVRCSRCQHRFSVLASGVVALPAKPEVHDLGGADDDPHASGAPPRPKLSDSGIGREDARPKLSQPPKPGGNDEVDLPARAGGPASSASARAGVKEGPGRPEGDLDNPEFLFDAGEPDPPPAGAVQQDDAPELRGRSSGFQDEDFVEDERDAEAVFGDEPPSNEELDVRPPSSAQAPAPAAGDGFGLMDNSTPEAPTVAPSTPAIAVSGAAEPTELMRNTSDDVEKSTPAGARPAVDGAGPGDAEAEPDSAGEGAGDPLPDIRAQRDELAASRAAEALARAERESEAPSAASSGTSRRDPDRTASASRATPPPPPRPRPQPSPDPGAIAAPEAVRASDRVAALFAHCVGALFLLGGLNVLLTHGTSAPTPPTTFPPSERAFEAARVRARDVEALSLVDADGERVIAIRGKLEGRFAVPPRVSATLLDEGLQPVGAQIEAEPIWRSGELLSPEAISSARRGATLPIELRSAAGDGFTILIGDVPAAARRFTLEIEGL